MQNMTEIPVQETWCKSLEGEYVPECYTYCFEPLIEEDVEAKLKRWEQLIDNQFDDTAADPGKPQKGQGPTVYIGFDSEFVPGDEERDNVILSLQFYLVGECGVMQRVVYPSGPEKSQRPHFCKIIFDLIQEAMDRGVVLEWPNHVVLVGFFLRIDLQAFGDLVSFKQALENVGGRVSSVKSSVLLEPEVDDLDGLLNNQTYLATDRDGVFRTLKVRFVDAGGHVAMGTSLAQIGDWLDLPKLELPEGYLKERMDLLLQGNKHAFEKYGLRDSEIAVRFYLHLLDFAEKHAGKRSLPATASSLAVRIFTKTLKDSQVDFNAAFGVTEGSSTYWNSTRERVVTKTEKSPSPMRAINEPFIASCYSGGRNECYAFGPTTIGVFNDFDLAGAYTTGMVDLRHIDYDRYWYSRNPQDFVGHVLGFAYVRFAFPKGTRFPSMPVRNSHGGLVYPLTGLSYCTAPEIEVALNLGCKLDILHGVIFPWCEGDNRLFEPYVMHIRSLRKSFVKGSLFELYSKLLGNSLYGKTAQGLKAKTVFDSQGMKSVELPHSILTNAAIAAHTTGFVRAVLSEQIAGIPPHRNVISATTDGFITDADESELALNGPMAKRFQTLCQRVAPGSKMLERKHRVRQLIAMKTRGQLTAIPFESDPFILAKAGVSPQVESALHNDFMVDLFMNRCPGDMTITRPFTPFREQWVKDADVVRLTRQSRLNLEFDFKRRLLDPLEISVADGEHLSLTSVPWNDLAEFERARAVFDGWREKHCLKTLGDFNDWEDHYQFALVRDRLTNGCGRSFGIRPTSGGITDVFRRLFLRAYTQGLCGLIKTMTYPELAAWLTERGYPTKDSEVKNAVRSKFIEHAVPLTPRTAELKTLLVEGFPNIEIEKFIAIN
ncbi:DNA polymerase [Dechloromonas sp. XY25]|uniref:DNA-directed DNA polymerase n=1 Tax=Dechloromonas hankyongensis TaxID=2908002 RepID=A0ABS9K4Q7_9RHOO|nr:DNA polymerase [Dechloromonas hankyongensis]MCG2578075.1 DNA polymerase [Dechloromonas hankyongensis]